jgi:hypothetical protein
MVLNADHFVLSATSQPASHQPATHRKQKRNLCQSKQDLGAKQEEEANILHPWFNVASFI